MCANFKSGIIRADHARVSRMVQGGRFHNYALREGYPRARQQDVFQSAQILRHEGLPTRQLARQGAGRGCDRRQAGHPRASAAQSRYCPAARQSALASARHWDRLPQKLANNHYSSGFGSPVGSDSVASPRDAQVPRAPTEGRQSRRCISTVCRPAKWLITGE